MRKIFTKLLGLMALCLICALNARAATDEKGNFIYYSGTGGFRNFEPEYPEYYEDWKLYETAPGSNVYSRLFTQFGDYSEISFKFYTELNDYGDFEYNYRSNLIAPVDHSDPDSYNLKRTAKSIIYSGDAKSYRLCTAKEINYFVAPLENKGYNYYIVVDMNLGKVMVLPEVYSMVVFKDQPEPELSTITDYISCGQKYYLEPGDYQFNMYDWVSKKWIAPNSSNVALYDNGITYAYDNKAADDRNFHYEIKNWPGGII